MTIVIFVFAVITLVAFTVLKGTKQATGKKS